MWKKEGEVLIATATVRTRDERTFKVPLRIDPREARVRVDKHDLVVWVAIDPWTSDGPGFATVKEAKAYAARWVEEANKQGRLSPRMEA